LVAVAGSGFAATVGKAAATADATGEVYGARVRIRSRPEPADGREPP
jgi:hypothetical protein